MSLKIDLLTAASSLASHSYRRQAIIANNIANADTPDFKSKDLEKFELKSTEKFSMRMNRPEHSMNVSDSGAAREINTTAFGSFSPNGNTVSLEDQMVRSSDVQHQHELALGVYQKSLAILKLSLGRR